MMRQRVIRFSLKPEKQYLTADQYNDSVSEAFDFLDMVYTYFFRYPWLMDQIEGANGLEGAGIDFMASNPQAAVALTLILGAAAIHLAIKKGQEQKVENQKKASDFKCSYDLIQDRLMLLKEPTLTSGESKEDDSHANAGELDLSKKVEKQTNNLDMNEILQQDADANLRKKYEKIEIINNQVVFTLKDKETDEKSSFLVKFSNSKAASFLSATWTTLGLCSFAYWILYIGAIVATGGAVVGLGVAGFAVPLAVGGIYALMKTYQWGRNYFAQKEKGQIVEKDPRLVLEAMSDASALLNRAIVVQEKLRLKKKFKIDTEYKAEGDALSEDSQSFVLGQGKWRKSAVTFLSETISAFIGAEYLAWLVTDLLQAAGVVLNMAGLAFGVGIAMLVCSGLYGIYKAAITYQEVETNKAKIKDLETEQKKKTISLDNNYKSQLKDIEALRKEIDGLAKKHNRQADLNWLKEHNKQFNFVAGIDSKAESDKQSTDKWAGIKTGIKKFSAHAFIFVAGATTGIMIARAATVIGTLTFLPFVAASLSNPVTIGIIAAAGLVYGLFKVYQYYEAKKENKAKALFEQRAHKIEILKSQSEVAELQIKLLTERAELLRYKGPSKTAQDDSVVLSAKRAELWKHKELSKTTQDDLVVVTAKKNEGRPLTRARNYSSLLKFFNPIEEKLNLDLAETPDSSVRSSTSSSSF